MVLAAAGVGAQMSRRAIERQLAERTDEDYRSILKSLRNQPPPAPRVISSLSPYRTFSNCVIAETGGPQRAFCRLVDGNSGLIIETGIHTCRPTVIAGGDRTGELNLVDGSAQDLSTSGGMVRIVDPQTDEDFLIYFKLLGVPNGVMSWNARQLVSPRTDTQSWQETLSSLLHNLPPAAVPTLPPTVRERPGVLETFDVSEPSKMLMHGSRREMMRLLMFRTAFEQFYANPDADHAERVVWIVLDTLLGSKAQQDVSRQWIAHLNQGP